MVELPYQLALTHIWDCPANSFAATQSLSTTGGRVQ